MSGVLVRQAAVFQARATKAQMEVITRWIGCDRFVWNQCVELVDGIRLINRFSEAEPADRLPYPGLTELAGMLPGLKGANPWLNEAPAISLVDVTRRYDASRRKALNDLASGKPKAARAGFPSFAKKRDGYGSVYLTGQGLKLEATDAGRGRGVVILPKLEGDLARLRLRGGRWPNGHINSARLKLHNGKLFLSVQWDGPAPTGRKPMPTPPRGPVLGVDLGLTDLVAESTGVKHAAPKLLRQREEERAILQRRFSRQDRKEKLAKSRRRSMRQRRRQQKIARLHRQVRNRRQDHLHQLSHALIAKARVIGLETLGIKALARGRHAKSVHDAGWGELVRQIDYKAGWHQREIRRMRRFDRSTGCCPDCGTVGPRLEEGIQQWTCAACGVVQDRDIAAARWIALHAKAPPQGMGNAGSVARRRGLGLRRKRACKPVAEAEGAANVHLSALTGNPAASGVESE